MLIKSIGVSHVLVFLVIATTMLLTSTSDIVVDESDGGGGGSSGDLADDESMTHVKSHQHNHHHHHHHHQQQQHQNTGTQNQNTLYAQRVARSNNSTNLVNNNNNNNNSFGEDDEWLNNLAGLHQKVSIFRIFYMYSGTVITIMGAILNALCIVVFYKSKLFRNSSFPYYVYVISFVDILNVFLRFLVPQAYEAFVRNQLESRFNITPDLINQLDYDLYKKFY